ncbi:MAG: Uma2 family endonuclease [Acidobacteria bacterium]|nr:Uma2 family endonuclease [Acidobacteriota bacterium]
METLTSQPLVAGERLSRDEFLRRWELLPHIKRAELIGGVVYMPSPVSIGHAVPDLLAGAWLANYVAATPGCEAGANCTWLMREDAPQPDASLFILPEYGGQCWMEGPLVAGAPELAIEVAVSSAARDLGPRLELYRAAGVQEYVNVLVKESRIIYRRLVEGAYVEMHAEADGLLHSVVFPGLWLDPHALLERKGARLFEALNKGLQSPEHADFVQALARRRTGGERAQV